MATIAFARPIQPGKTDAFRQFLAEVEGPRRAAYEASRRRHGFTSDRAWLEHTPRGDIAVIVMEAADPRRSLAQMEADPDPFLAWWHEQTRAIHGESIASPDLVFEWHE
ncbi:MAG: hypothetical protein ACRDJE_15130 [Dehalococcoidia bacterium]